MIEKYITLGRAKDNDITISDKTVSTYHARIIITHQGFEIEDMESSNGTRVNDKLVSKAPISPGDEIKLGTMSSLKINLMICCRKVSPP